jgi:histidyl-tRNA synthetase
MLSVGSTEIGREGLAEMREISEYFEAAGIDQSRYVFDPSIARGLAHYTGPVWEFEVKEGSVGAIAGCGRYDNIIGTYLGGDKFVPATGGSFGIERICEVLKERKLVDFGSTTVEVMVTIFDEELWKESLSVANQLREKGISTMLYPDPIKIGDQFKYANKKGIPWVVVIGPDEVAKKVVQLKDMKKAEQKSCTVEVVVKAVKG